MRAAFLIRREEDERPVVQRQLKPRTRLWASALFRAPEVHQELDALRVLLEALADKRVLEILLVLEGFT